MSRSLLKQDYLCGFLFLVGHEVHGAAKLPHFLHVHCIRQDKKRTEASSTVVCILTQTTPHERAYCTHMPHTQILTSPNYVPPTNQTKIQVGWQLYTNKIDMMILPVTSDPHSLPAQVSLNSLSMNARKWGDVVRGFSFSLRASPSRSKSSCVTTVMESMVTLDEEEARKNRKDTSCWVLHNQVTNVGDEAAIKPPQHNYS